MEHGGVSVCVLAMAVLFQRHMGAVFSFGGTVNLMLSETVYMLHQTAAS